MEASPYRAGQGDSTAPCSLLNNNMVPVTWSYTWFPALRCRLRFCNRFRKNRVCTCRSVNAVAVYAVAGACSAAGPVGSPARSPRKRVGRALGAGYSKTEK